MTVSKVYFLREIYFELSVGRGMIENTKNQDILISCGLYKQFH